MSEIAPDWSHVSRLGRAVFNWSQADLAERMGVSASYVSYLEAGKRAWSGSAASKLASALCIDQKTALYLAGVDRLLDERELVDLFVWLRPCGVRLAERGAA